jgi:hypothetical protein
MSAEITQLSIMSAKVTTAQQNSPAGEELEAPQVHLL